MEEPTTSNTDENTRLQQEYFVNIVNDRIAECNYDPNSKEYIFGLVRILKKFDLEATFTSPTTLHVTGTLVREQATASSDTDVPSENIQVNYVLDVSHSLSILTNLHSFLDKYLVSALQTCDMAAISFFMGVYSDDLKGYTNVRITENLSSGPIPYTFLLKAQDSIALAVLKNFETFKIPLNISDVYGNTLVMCMVTQNNLESVKYLLSLHPEMFSQTNIHGNTLIDVVNSRINLEAESSDDSSESVPSRYLEMKEYLLAYESSIEMDRVD